MLNGGTADELPLFITKYFCPHLFVSEDKWRSPHIRLSLFFELQKYDGKREFNFLGHRNAVPWNFTSGTVPRVKHREPANSQTGCSEKA